VTVTSSAQSRRTGFRAPSEIGIFTVLVLVVVVLSIMSPSFRTVDNALSLLLNGAVIAFLTLGQMMVLLTGGIDLSAGATVALTGVAAALTMAYGAPWWLAVVVALGLGLLVGAVNGFIIHYGRVPAFIATFAMMGVASAIPMVLTNAASITVIDRGFAIIGQGKVLTVPVPVILLVIAAVVVAIVLARTTFGVHVYAMGGSAPAARLAGINIGRNIVTVYALSGFFAAIGGLILTSRLMVGYPSAGLGNELFYSIAAAVVGGVSLFGGVGTVGGAMIGAVLIATVTNGLNVLNVNSYWQSFVIGIIILAGVFYDTNRARLRGNPVAKRLSALTRRSPSADA
jgi:ribose transport system permease protein